MGYDTLVNGDYLDRSLRLISSAIQDKSRLHSSIDFDDFAARISALPDDALSKLLHGTLTEYVNGTPTAIPADLFKGQDKLQKIDMTSVKSVGNNAFRECSALVEVNLPVLETLGSAAFIHCTALAEVKFPAVLSSGVAVNALRYCSALKKVDFGEINAAVALYSVFQVVFMSMCLAYGAVTLYEMKLSSKVILLYICFCAFMPYNIMYSFTM